MISAESVKARLKNQAHERGHILQEELTAYGIERTVYRISISDHMDKFTLKGGILYALFDGDFARATTDLDLLAQITSNEAENIKAIFKEIFTIEADDALRYEFKTLVVHPIAKFKEYPGVKVSIMAYLDKTRIPLSIDIGFGDIVYPRRVLMDFPVLLDMDIPKIYTYSLASVVAEKFEAIVSLGYANSRYKDFYDIYMLLNKCNFDGSELRNAINETFVQRKTGYGDIVAFEDEFTEDTVRKNRWNAFIKKKKTMIYVEFVTAVDSIKTFLEPVVKAIVNEEDFDKEWAADKRQWSRKG